MTISIDHIPFLRELILVAFGIPIVPIVLGWRSLLRARADRATVILLTLVTASYLWILAVAAAAPVVAPHYSDLRFGTIYLNAGVMFLSAVMALVRRPLRWQLLSASGALVFLWSYVAVVSSVA